MKLCYTCVYFSSYYMDHTENDSFNNSVIVACVFLAAVTSCLATLGGIHIQTHRLMEGMCEVQVS
jgi:hypothetical protein